MYAKKTPRKQSRLLFPSPTPTGDNMSSDVHYTVEKLEWGWAQGVGWEMNGAEEYVQHGERVEQRKRNAWDMMEEGDERKREAGGEGGRERARERWMESSRGCSRTGLLPGCSPDSLYRETQRHEEEERAKGRFRREGEKASWERGKQDDDTEKKSESRKREGVRRKVSKSPDRCRRVWFPCSYPSMPVILPSHPQNRQKHLDWIRLGELATGSVSSNKPCLLLVQKNFMESESCSNFYKTFFESL